jgi:integrase
LANALAAARETKWPALGDIVQFVALTGWRISEACLLKWEQVNTDARLATLETKTGVSRRPLSKHAIALLEARRASSAASGFVFPTIDGGPVEKLCSGKKSAWARLVGPLWSNPDPLTGERVTAHTLRHSFVSLGVELGFNLSTVGAIVGHSSPDVGGVRENRVTGGYVHLLDNTLMTAADEISNRIAALMAGGNVVALDGRRRRAELRDAS